MGNVLLPPNPNYPNCGTNTSLAWPGMWGLASFHPGGANVLFCDGSVHFLKETIDMGSPNYSTVPGGINIGVYRKLSTRNGGEVVSTYTY